MSRLTVSTELSRSWPWSGFQNFVQNLRKAGYLQAYRGKPTSKPTEGFSLLQEIRYFIVVNYKPSILLMKCLFSSQGGIGYSSSLLLVWNHWNRMLLRTPPEKLLSVSSLSCFFFLISYSVTNDIKSTLNARVVVAWFFTVFHLVFLFPKHCFLRCTGTALGKNNTKKTAIITWTISTIYCIRTVGVKPQ